MSGTGMQIQLVAYATIFRLYYITDLLSSTFKQRFSGEPLDSLHYPNLLFLCCQLSVAKIASEGRFDEMHFMALKLWCLNTSSSFSPLPLTSLKDHRDFACSIPLTTETFSLLLYVLSKLPYCLIVNATAGRWHEI